MGRRIPSWVGAVLIIVILAAIGFIYWWFQSPLSSAAHVQQMMENADKNEPKIPESLRKAIEMPKAPKNAVKAEHSGKSDSNTPHDKSASQPSTN
jgi:hypothetical protein